MDTRILPQHVAIIPDGNRRWARARGLSALDGHRRGAKVFRDLAMHAADQGLRHLSFWGMSLDNFSKRTAREVAGLLNLFRTEFRELASSKEIHARRVRISVIGRWRERFPLPVRRAIESALAATERYQDHVLTFFLAYNGTDEMLDAVGSLVQQAREGKDVSVTPEVLKQHLWTSSLPAVDLLIRTAGEPHLSAGFMMWDVADAHMYFTDLYWPDFTPQEFDKALSEYASRERRFGK
jgi:undecaprenyl diphosphate synthase